MGDGASKPFDWVFGHAFMESSRSVLSSSPLQPAPPSSNGTSCTSAGTPTCKDAGFRPGFCVRLVFLGLRLGFTPPASESGLGLVRSATALGVSDVRLDVAFGVEVLLAPPLGEHEGDPGAFAARLDGEVGLT